MLPEAANTPNAWRVGGRGSSSVAGFKLCTGLMAAVSDCVQALRAPRTGGCLQVESDASVVKDQWLCQQTTGNP